MRTRDADLFFVPGLGGSGPDHWQSRWQARLPNARRIEQDDWDHPELDAWTGRIAEALDRAERPAVVLAHSLGVIALARAVPRLGRPPAGAFLVAPPSEATVAGVPEIDPAFRPFPSAPLPFPSLMAGSRTDPYATAAETEALALDWGAKYLDAGDAGHLNAASGHGPWPEGLMAFGGFLNRLG